MRSPCVFLPEFLQYRFTTVCPLCGHGAFESENYDGCYRKVIYLCGHNWLQVGIGDGSLDQDKDGYYPNLPPTVVVFWFDGDLPLELEVHGLLERHDLRGKDAKKSLQDAKRYLDALGIRMGRRERAAFIEAYAAEGLGGLLHLINQVIPEGISHEVDSLNRKMVAAAKALLS